MDQTQQLTTTPDAPGDYAFWANLREYNQLKRSLDKTTDVESRWRILRRMEALNDELEDIK